ncbi:hypothetical protein ACLBX9_18305 [Methylobacterium sp. A49B]
MTSLTPQRDTLTRVLAEARSASEQRPVADAVEAIERRLCLDLMEVALLPCADMMDLAVPMHDIQARLENAFANVIVSHSLSLSAGDRDEATQIAGATLLNLSQRVQRAIENNNPSVSVQRAVDRVQTGAA